MCQRLLRDRPNPDNKFGSRRAALINRMPVYWLSPLVVYAPSFCLCSALMLIGVMAVEAPIIITLLIVVCSGIRIFVGWMNGPACAAGGGAPRSDVNGVMIEG